ncbi:MAG: hypothetical protein HRU19_11410 [Pseudobacteriovorax sp.]|nr:hypothetical protein [Pseudobacteriovorax sp.]
MPQLILLFTGLWCLLGFHRPVVAKPNPSMFVFTIWQGEHIKEHDVKALETYRTEFPQVSMIHFISPRYLIAPNTGDLELNQAIKRVYRPGDEKAVYFAGWEELVSKAGVLVRNSPSFWTNKSTPCTKACGLSIPLSVYGEDDLKKILNSQKQLLDEGLSTPINDSIFLTAGWQNLTNQSRTLSQLKLKWDFSGIIPSTMKKPLGRYPIHTWIRSNWHILENVHSPKYLTESKHSRIIVAQNGGMTSYHSAEDIYSYYKAFKLQKSQGPKVFTLGVVQETAFMYQGRLKQATQMILDASKKEKTPLNFTWQTFMGYISPSN